MVELSNVVEGGELDPVTVGFVLIALFTGLALMFNGIQTQSLPLALVGAAFTITPLIGIVLTEGTILTGTAGFGLAATSYWLGRAIFEIPSILGGVEFSVFSAPTTSYLSLLGQTNTPVRFITNLYLAPVVENIALIGGAVILYKVLRGQKIPKIPSFAVSAGIFALTFGLLHGATSTAFLITAFVVMMIWMVLTIGTDIGIVSIPIIPATFALTVSLHQANNIQASAGSSLAYYNTILGASGGLNWAATIIVAWEILLLVAAVVYVGSELMNRF